MPCILLNLNSCFKNLDIANIESVSQKVPQAEITQETLTSVLDRRKWPLESLPHFGKHSFLSSKRTFKLAIHIGEIQY